MASTWSWQVHFQLPSFGIMYRTKPVYVWVCAQREAGVDFPSVREEKAEDEAEEGELLVSTWRLIAHSIACKLRQRKTAGLHIRWKP